VPRIHKNIKYSVQNITPQRSTCAKKDSNVDGADEGDERQTDIEMLEEFHDKDTEGSGDAERDELYTECRRYYHQPPRVLHSSKRHLPLDTPAPKSKIHQEEKSGRDEMPLFIHHYTTLNTPEMVRDSAKQKRMNK
jgi:hypothetical protein